jgi:hypothetical protein
VEYCVAVKHVVAEDMPRPLSNANENVMMHGADFNNGEMLVMYWVVLEIMAAKYVEVEDMLWPLSLAKDIVMMRSSYYDNTGTEEVLVDLTEQLEVFPPTQRQMKYEVTEQQEIIKKVERYFMGGWEVRGDRAAGRGEVHCEDRAEGQGSLCAP